MTISIYSGDNCESTYISNACLFGIKITDKNNNNIIQICTVFHEESLREFKTMIIKKELTQGKFLQILMYDHPELTFAHKCFEEFPEMEIINIEANGFKIIATV